MSGIPDFGADGLLPMGAHRATLAEVEAAFVRPECGDETMRAAVFASIGAWLTMAQRCLGPGVCWVGGGFVSRGEATDTAMVVYLPEDRALAAAAVANGAAIDLVSLLNVAYSYPGSGGGLSERWPVSGLVDAQIADTVTAAAYRNVLAVVRGPDGFAVQGTVKGYVEVEVTAE